MLKNILKNILLKLKSKNTKIHWSCCLDYYTKYGENNIFSKNVKISSSEINSNINFNNNVSVSNSIIKGFNNIGSNTRIFNVNIAEYSYISEQSIVINTEIGKFCSLGPFLMVGYGIHPTHLLSTSPMFYSDKKQNGKTFCNHSIFEEYQKTTIGHDVWIGARVILKDGIKIGNGAVIGAGAVVTKDVPDFAIVGGIPAQLIKYRFDEKTILKIKKLNWWNESDIFLEKNLHLFQNSKFINDL